MGLRLEGTLEDRILLRRAQPGILPGNRDVLEVAAIPDVSAIAVAEFQRLMFAYRD